MNIHDSGQERQDSFQYPLSQNNIIVPLAEGQTVSWDHNDDEIEVPEFIGLATKVNNTILLQKIFIPLMTRSGIVEDFNILLYSGRNRSFILNLALDKLEAKHIAIEKLTFGSSNVPQSGLRNLHDINMSSSLQVQCLGLETISFKIFKPKLSSDVIKEFTQLDVQYLNADEGIEIHNMLIGLYYYLGIIQPDFIRFSCGFVA